MEFDVDKGTGYYDYIFGPYKFSSVAFLLDSFLLSLTSDKLGTTVLQISKESPDATEIDKKIFSLSQLPNIKTISVSRNFGYIAPDLGEPEYNFTTKNFEFNKEKIQAYDQIINDEITKLGIDRTVYTLINTSTEQWLPKQ